MSKDKHDADGVLERNVTTLLETGGEAPRISDAARARIRDELVAQHRAITPARTRTRPVWAVGLGLAATAMAAVVVVHVVGGGGSSPPVAPGHALADGTTWTVAPGGQVTVLGARRVRVEGAALLDVAPGAVPFVVETARGTVEVLGTKFLVAAEPARTTAAVVRGQVKLASSDGSVLLHAGEQGIAEPGKPPTRAPAPRLSHLASWAKQARVKDEAQLVQPVRNGTLFARDPNNPNVPESPLPIAKLTVDIVVEDQVARVALDQTFHNPAPRVLEGSYRFAIPPDAALQRLAMYVDGTLTESAVVERMRARRIYEDIVYRRLDPALLEWAGTGRLNLRVYPLFARQDRRLLLAYTQSLPKLYDDWTIQVPLPEVDQPVGELAFDVRIKACGNCEVSSPSHAIQVRHDGEDAVVTYRQQRAKLGDSLVLRTRDKRSAPTVTTHVEGSDRYVMVRARAAIPREAASYRPRTWIILDDVSASRGPMELRAQADLVDGFLQQLDEEDRVAVVAFDVAAREKLPLTRVMDVDRTRVHAALKDEGGVGATNFEAALAAATKLLGGVAPEDARVLYLGDGVITTGARNLDTIRQALVGKAQFIGVGVGDGPDTQTLEALAAATGGYATTIDLADDLAWRTFDLVAALHTPRVVGLEAQLVDATGTALSATLYARAGQLADGEELELVGKLASTGTPVAALVAGTLAGRPWSQRIELGAPRTGGYLPRLWAQRHIAARLLAKHDAISAPPCTVTRTAACPTESELRRARDEAIRQEVVALGKQHFLLSRHTSLIVLENDAMYAKYGVTKGRGDTWAPYQTPAKIPVVVATTPAGIADDAALVRSPLVLFANVSDGWARTNARWDRDAFTLDERARFGLAQVQGATAAALPPAPPAREEAKRKADRDAVTGEAEAQQVTSDELRGIEPDTRGSFASLAGIGIGDGVSGGLLGKGRIAGSGDGYGSWITPQRLTYPTDPTFDDVTAFVPALARDALDDWRRELGADAGGASSPPAPMDPTARRLLAAARAALPTGVYRWGDAELAVDAARRLGWKRTTETGLRETASYDGTTFTRRYAELGLDVTRPLADDDVALSLGYFPLLVADPAHYARWFIVGTRGPRTVTLSRRGRGAPTLAYVLELDDKSRLVAILDGEGTELLRVDWGTLAFTAQPIADAVAWAQANTATGVVVELPGRLPTFHEAQLTTRTPGTPAWRHTMRQHLASLAATNARGALLAAYDALRANGGVELGDLALASGGVPFASPAQVAAIAAAHGDAPLAQYLLAARRLYERDSPAGFVASSSTGFVGALWTLREVTARLYAGDGKRAAARVTAIDPGALALRLVGAGLLAHRAEVRAADAARAFDAVAVGAYRNIARAQAALVLGYRGDYDGAAERIAALVTDLDLTAAPPELASLSSIFQSSRRGMAGWQVVWATWRDRVLASTSFEHVMALLGTGVAHRQDVPRILARAMELAGSDPRRMTSVARLAIAAGQGTWAASRLEPLVKQRPSRELHQLLAQLASDQGRAADAFAHLEAAQGLASDQAVPLTTVRQELTQLLVQARELAMQSTGRARDEVVAKALAWGQRWRAIDPGNPAIDVQLGELMLAIGDTNEAWRQLSSAIERDPMAGEGYAIVASQYERQGRVADAVALWQQAAVLDQTNPTHRLRHAQALIALGKGAEGDAILTDIARGTWHARWEGIPHQARALLERAKRRHE